MQVLTYILIGIMFVCAAFIVVAVLLQKTKEDGLSGAISGKQDTFYSKDKSGRTNELLKKLTIIGGVVFAVCVLLIFIIQPDYAFASAMDGWKDLTSFGKVFK